MSDIEQENTNSFDTTKAQASDASNVQTSDAAEARQDQILQRLGNLCLSSALLLQYHFYPDIRGDHITSEDTVAKFPLRDEFMSTAVDIFGSVRKLMAGSPYMLSGDSSV